MQHDLIEWAYRSWTDTYSAGESLWWVTLVEIGVLRGNALWGPLSSSQFLEPVVSTLVCSLFVCSRTSSYCKMHKIIQSRRWTLCKQQQTRIVKRKKLAFI